MSDARAALGDLRPTTLPGFSTAYVRQWRLKKNQAQVACQYPRSPGIVIPPELAGVCQGIDQGPLPCSLGQAGSDVADVAARATLARAVLKRVAATAHALPRPLLESELPSPEQVLRTFVLDHRTRQVLARGQPFKPVATWTVGRYLDIPRFGPFCLVDLLAARAESTVWPARHGARTKRGPTEAVNATNGAPVQSFLDELSALLVRSLPISSERITQLLTSEGMPQFASVRALEGAYRSAGQPPPFRVIRHAGCDLLVAPSARDTAKSVLAAASQFVSWWGLTTVQEIVTRTQLHAASLITAAFVERVLATFPRVVWLDPHRRWFSFLENRSRLRTAVEAALAAHGRLEVPTLRRALAKEKTTLGKLPAVAWERYLSAVAGCTIEGQWAVSPALTARAPDSLPCLA